MPFVSHSSAAGRSPALDKRNKPVCKFCQRSRWLMTATILIVLASVAVLNLTQ